MEYKVIGLMSGSSLDGLDIVFVHLQETRGSWSFEIKQAECIPYNTAWTTDLKNIQNLSVAEYLTLNTRYGLYLANTINDFIERHAITHQVDFIASHGHTAYHDTAQNTSVQLGCGATIAAHTQIPVISELRAMDVALGGKGAPIVPIGDQLLFGNYDYWLNIGGIVNISLKKGNSIQAFDVCAGNQILNTLAEKLDQEMDYEGKIARKGSLLQGVLAKLNQQNYFLQAPPKSLSNEAAQQLAFPILFESAYALEDLMHTYVSHIVEQVTMVIRNNPATNEKAQLLLTGGGAFNSFLVEQLTASLADEKVTVVVPDATTVKFKEAVVMALIGALRWREDINVLASVTGATRSSIGGALWMGRQ